jgi:acyl carrier protein
MSSPRYWGPLPGGTYTASYAPIANSAGKNSLFYKTRRTSRMFLQKKKYGDFIIKTLKEVTFKKKITKETNLKIDIDIDSIAWVQILFKIEQEFGQFRDMDTLINSTYETVEELIAIIKKHYEN